MKVRIIGAHNCETSVTRHTCLLIDDVLAVDAGSLTPDLSLDAQKNIKAVLLSHRHYDHIRDVITLGTNLFHAGLSTDVYASAEVIDVLNTHFFKSKIYRDLASVPEGDPTLRLHTIEPGVTIEVAGYEVTPIPVTHKAFTTGFKIVSADGMEMFYTSDTGPELESCWKHISPQLLIIETTETNASEAHFRTAGHLTPSLLREELLSFRKLRNYLPDVITVHMSPEMETTIRQELESVAAELDCEIIPGVEGLEYLLG